MAELAQTTFRAPATIGTRHLRPAPDIDKPTIKGSSLLMPQEGINSNGYKGHRSIPLVPVAAQPHFTVDARILENDPKTLYIKPIPKAGTKFTVTQAIDAIRHYLLSTDVVRNFKVQFVEQYKD